MTVKKLLKILIRIKSVFILGCRTETEGGVEALAVSVRQHKSESGRCPVCGRKCRGYDRGYGKRRWRALDFGAMRVYIECRTRRVRCREHGVVTEAVSWARHGSAFTRDFEDTAAWLAKNSAKTVVSEMMGIAWHTVGEIIKRVTEEAAERRGSLFDNLVRIGIDETSYKKGHKYMMTVVNHDTGKIIWACASYGKEPLEKFFKTLTEEQRGSIRHITADGAKWIAETAQEWCPNAERSIDPFHVVQWVNEALDEVRRRLVRDAAAQVKAAKKGTEEEKAAKKETRGLKDMKYAALKNPENLTAGQAAKVELMAKSNPVLYRAYLLKEKIRLVFRHNLDEAKDELNGWLKWAQRCRIHEFVELRNKIKRHFDAILSTIKYGLSNSLVESINNKIKLTIRMAYGFRNIDNMLALIMLRCSSLDVCLPGRPISTHDS